MYMTAPRAASEHYMVFSMVKAVGKFEMKLLEFPHSHLCEKARWALDYKGLPFESVVVMPGFHVKRVRKYAPKTSVSVLLHGPEVVQGFGTIIDYLDTNYPARLLTPHDPALQQACLAMEEEMDIRLGKNLRQILYYWLLDHPRFLRHCFTHSLPLYKQLFSGSPIHIFAR